MWRQGGISPSTKSHANGNSSTNGIHARGKSPITNTGDKSLVIAIHIGYHQPTIPSHTRGKNSVTTSHTKHKSSTIAIHVE